jgi:hypothetical protein
MLVLTDAGDIPFIHCLILISHTWVGHDDMPPLTLCSYQKSWQ